MLPDKLVEFLGGPVVMLVGARSEDLRPAISFAFGGVVDAGSDSITFFLPNVEGEAILRNLDQNGKVAFTVVEGISHETYQFKGKCIEARPVSEQERALQVSYREKMVPHYAAKGVPERYFGRMVYDPSTAVTFRVEEIFDQTPGPGAGGKLDFSPGT